MRTPLPTLSYIARHPLASRRPLRAFARYAWWQAASVAREEIEFDWFAGAKLIVRRGMTGATGNIYCGLHEFYDMGFALHFLRPGDLFVDVGANVGSYTVLAAAVCGAEVIAVEPDPSSLAWLKRNALANRVEDRVECVEAAVGADNAVVRLTVGRDTMNRVGQGEPSREVVQRTLDEIIDGRAPALLKLDVEGYEAQVIAGARQTIANKSLLAIVTETVGEAVRGPLEAAGFRPYSYDPFARTLTSERRAWSIFAPNALFLREPGAVHRRVDSAPQRSVAGVTF